MSTDNMVDVARAGDLAPNTALKVEVESHDIALVRCDRVSSLLAIAVRTPMLTSPKGKWTGVRSNTGYTDPNSIADGQPLSLPALSPFPYRVEVVSDGDDARILIDPTPQPTAAHE